VPIAVFVKKDDGSLLRDPTVNERIVTAIEAEGADAWFASKPERFLGNDYNSADYTQVTDILDVWFDSGATHSFVLEQRPDLKWPASLYLEGSDQHRGWFHSSLLESCGTRGRAPYDGVLTHGFVMAEDGQKMSKSLGNVVAPQEVIAQSGADILRLWVVGSDYSEDLRIGPEILKYHADIYRRIRNTLRYLLGNLDGFDERERGAVADMPELERWVLHRLSEIDRSLRDACTRLEYHHIFTELHNFCAVDLSAFYLDIRKDSLYCDRADSPRRRATRTVLDQLFNCLTAWVAPFCCFTAEEAWLARHPSETESVHLRTFPDIPADWRDDALAARWARIRDLRRVVTGAIELERAEKRIRSSLEAAPVIYMSADYADVMKGIDLAEIAITSDASLSGEAAPANAFTLADVAGVAVVPRLAEGAKCVRCYRVLPEVTREPARGEVCDRCADAVAHFPVAAE
jgi:isoleucyl-tRNA synthetase